MVGITSSRRILHYVVSFDWEWLLKCENMLLQDVCLEWPGIQTGFGAIRGLQLWIVKALYG